MKQTSLYVAMILALLVSMDSSGMAADKMVRSTVRSTDKPDQRGENRQSLVIKWEETFPGTTVPAGWRVVDVDGGGTPWAFTQLITFTSGDTVRPQAGASFWFGSYNDANASRLINDYIISPRLPVVVAGDSLHFYAGAIAGQYPDSLRVWVSTTDSAIGSFTNLIAYFRVAGPTGTWHKYSMSLSQFAGSRPFIAVNYFIVDGGPLGASSDNLWVDHFIHEGNPPSAVEENGQLPATYAVGRNYPNPFNPTTTIEYTMQKASPVKLIVYNLLGQEVRTLVNGFVQAGKHSAVWDGRSDSGAPVVSGIYLYRFVADGFVNTQSMVLLK